MRFESGSFVVDFSVNDKFVQVMRIDSSILGGKKVVGNFVEKKFKPERNTAFDLDDLDHIKILLNHLLCKIKW